MYGLYLHQIVLGQKHKLTHASECEHHIRLEGGWWVAADIQYEFVHIIPHYSAVSVPKCNESPQWDLFKTQAKRDANSSFDIDNTLVDVASASLRSK